MPAPHRRASRHAPGRPALRVAGRAAAALRAALGGLVHPDAWRFYQVLKEDDSQWPEPDRIGRQELEVVLGDDHVSFAAAKIGSLLDVQSSKDPEGLRVFYYLVQARPRAQRRARSAAGRGATAGKGSTLALCAAAPPCAGRG